MNVKLRYEQIIKNLIMNEEAGLKTSVVEVIATTKSVTKVNLETLSGTRSILTVKTVSKSNE